LIVTFLFRAIAVSTVAAIMAAGRSLPDFPGDELLESHKSAVNFGIPSAVLSPLRPR